MDLFGISDSFVKYLEFLLDFSIYPVRTLEAYRGLGMLDPTLFLFLVLGGGSAFVIFGLFKNLGARIDLTQMKVLVGPILTRLFSSDQDVKSVPSVTVAIIFVLTVAFQVVAWTWLQLTALLDIRVGHLGGTIKDTVNGAFAFAAFYLPYFMALLLSGMPLLKNIAETKRYVFDVIFMIFIVAPIFVHFPAALSAVHPKTTFWEAFGIMDASIVIFAIGAALFRNFLFGRS